METVSETLSEGSTPAAPPRSPEDQDLLERSTKKNKRGRSYLEAVTAQSRDVLMKETPDAVTPESANWKTPDDTPSQARGHEDTPLPSECGKNANVDGAAHPCDGTPQPPESVLAKAPLPAEKYGSWMLVSRKPRGNNGRGTKPPGSHPTVRQNGFPGEHRAHVGNQGLHSRFAPLDGLEEDSRDHQQENLFSPSGFQPPSDTLPRIRTNYRGGQRLQNQERPVPHFESEPRTEFPNHQPQMRGDFRGRGGRGRGPNRAAADTDHIVVRGSNRGRNITSTVVHQSRGVSPSPSLADFGNSYKHVPPDQASIQFVSGKWWMISVMWKVERQKQKTKDMGTWWRNKWKILSYMEF
nr:uncharacterized protein LOC109155288 [Ipomoea batatas]